MLFLGVACAVLGFVLFVIVGPRLEVRHQSYRVHLAVSNNPDISPSGRYACQQIAKADRPGHIVYYLVRGLGLFLSFVGGSILSHVFTLTTPVLILLGAILIAILAVLYMIYR